MNHLPGKFVWFEHMSEDIDRARAFYEPLFGWQTQEMPVGQQTYHVILNGSDPIGGFRSAPAGMPSHWASYLSVPDVDVSYAATLAAGATSLQAPADHGAVGREAAVADPSGAALSLWKGVDDDRPDTDRIAIGDWYWNELWTNDSDKALAFYEKVFGYTTDAMDIGPMGTYYLLKKDDRMRAGVMQSPNAAAPSMWLPYVHVADCDASTAHAERLGAQTIVPPSDIPGVGRFSVFFDPQRAPIAIIKGLEAEVKAEAEPASSLLHSIGAELGLTHGI